MVLMVIHESDWQKYKSAMNNMNKFPLVSLCRPRYRDPGTGGYCCTCSFNSCNLPAAIFSALSIAAVSFWGALKR